MNHRQHKFVTSVTSNKEGRRGTDLGRNYRRIPGCELHDLPNGLYSGLGSAWPRTGSRAGVSNRWTGTLDWTTVIRGVCNGTRGLDMCGSEAT